jgi:hypothetical protein
LGDPLNPSKVSKGNLLTLYPLDGKATFGIPGTLDPEPFPF